MGTSGNRKGYKVFSINTTLRNPKRNDDFLKAFIKYNGLIMDENALRSYLSDCVKYGIYKFMVVSNAVKKKWENDEPLTNEEVRQLIMDNPQATGLKGRVMTQLRALKDQGFLVFEKASKRGVHKITISKLGWDLLNGILNPSDVYTKAMIGMQAKSPIRTTIQNRSVPFLNTLFVINELQKLSAEQGIISKGLHRHEFSVFVLSMKDCDYKKAAKDIMEYRTRFGHDYNHSYCKEYLTKNDIIPLSKKCICGDYPDDVFRKFEMTGLVVKRGQSKYLYYDFSTYNFGKIQSILNQYKDYGWKSYSTIFDYYSAIASIKLPWEQDDSIRKRIVELKAQAINHPYDNSLSIEQNEEIMDRFFFTEALKKAISKTNLETICKELLILSGRINEDSKYEDISEPLRLEYLLAMFLGKKYGTDGLVSNILYNEDGLPLHCAAAGKCDIMYLSNDGAYILEPTMLSSRQQQMNAETTNVARHAREEEQRLSIQCRVLMVAPRIHSDVVDFFLYKVERDNAKMITLSIEKTVSLFSESSTILRLNENYDQILSDLKRLGPTKFADAVNSYVFAK